MMTDSVKLSMNAKLFAKIFFGGHYKAGHSQPYPHRKLTKVAVAAFEELQDTGFIKCFKKRNRIHIERDIPQDVTWKGIRNQKLLTEYLVYSDDTSGSDNCNDELFDQTILRQQIINTLARMSVIQTHLFSVLLKTNIDSESFENLDSAVRQLNTLSAPKILEEIVEILKSKA